MVSEKRQVRLFKGPAESTTILTFTVGLIESRSVDPRVVE